MDVGIPSYVLLCIKTGDVIMNNLRNIRRKKGLSLAEIAKQTEIPLRTLEMWDSNKRIPQSYHRIKELAVLLECTMDDIMTYKEDCVYEGKEVHVDLSTAERDTFFVVYDDAYNDIISEYITRDSAMDLLEQMKKDKDITDFVNNRIQFYQGQGDGV
jgi:transcriptional regulator with XRE-family HTH domain